MQCERKVYRGQREEIVDMTERNESVERSERGECGEARKMRV